MNHDICEGIQGGGGGDPIEHILGKTTVSSQCRELGGR